MALIREYNALIQITDSHVMSGYLTSQLDQAQSHIMADVVGIEVLDVNPGLSRSHPFTGRNEPKMDPEKASMTWNDDDSSGLSIEIGSSKSIEWLIITGGFAEIDAIRLRGRNHPEFNRNFLHGARVPVRDLHFTTDRRAAKQEYPARQSSLVLPLMARLSLLELS